MKSALSWIWDNVIWCNGKGDNFGIVLGVLLVIAVFTYHSL